MIKIYKIFFYPVILFLGFFFPIGELNAQTFGFGCLGLSGFYGGYSIQQFNADGLNESIKFHYEELGITDSDISFGEARGLRVGANIFRAKFDRYFITLKGYYQFLKEEKSIRSTAASGIYDDVHKLELNHWGIALDFGMPLFGFIDLKLVEGGIILYNAEVRSESTFNNLNLPEVIYSDSKSTMGYYLGTGLIIHIIPDYISLEGTAIYNFMEIKSLNEPNGLVLPLSSVNKNLVESGKLAAAVQLNVGFPL